jgi:hypothetical protein
MMLKVPSMTIRALFDKNRKEEIRKGLRDGSLDFGRRKLAGRNAEDGAQAGLSVDYRQKFLNETLFNSIRTGEYSAVKDAIERGADVNAIDPSSVFSGSEPEATVMFSLETPLALTKRLGHKDVEDVLRKHGAKE